MIASGTLSWGECGCTCFGCQNDNWHCCGTGCSHSEYTGTTSGNHEQEPEEKPEEKKPQKPQAHYKKNKKPWEH